MENVVDAPDIIGNVFGIGQGTANRLCMHCTDKEWAFHLFSL